MSSLHQIFSDPERLQLMDFLVAAGRPLNGREIAFALNQSERWVSRYLAQMADAGVIVREISEKVGDDVKNHIASDIVWPLHISAAAHYALSNPVRVRIMDFLATATGPVNVGDIVNLIGTRQGTASKHLIVLERVGLIVRTRDKRMVFSEIAPGIVWPPRIKQ